MKTNRCGTTQRNPNRPRGRVDYGRTQTGTTPLLAVLLVAIAAMGLTGVISACIPDSDRPSGWVDRMEDDWVVLVSGDPASGFREISVRRDDLPDAIEVGDWIVRGLVVPGSRAWISARVIQLQEQLGLRGEQGRSR